MQVGDDVARPLDDAPTAGANGEKGGRPGDVGRMLLSLLSLELLVGVTIPLVCELDGGNGDGKAFSSYKMGSRVGIAFMITGERRRATRDK